MRWPVGSIEGTLKGWMKSEPPERDGRSEGPAPTHAPRLTSAAALAAAHAQLLKDLSHALRGPLASIRTAADLLRGGMVDPADVETLAQVLSTEAARSAALLARVDELQQLTTMRFVPFEVRPLVESLVSLREAEFSLRKVRLELRGAEGSSDARFVVRADVTALTAALDALVQNALDACARRMQHAPELARLRVTLSIERATHEGHPCVRVCVCDEGDGLREPLDRRAFRVLYSGASEKPGQVTGFGLSLARLIVLAHGGAVELSPREGAGAEAVIVLPIDPSPAPHS